MKKDNRLNAQIVTKRYLHYAGYCTMYKWFCEDGDKLKVAHFMVYHVH